MAASRLERGLRAERIAKKRIDPRAFIGSAAHRQAELNRIREDVIRLRNDGMSVRDIVKIIAASRSWVYKVVSGMQSAS